MELINMVSKNQALMKIVLSTLAVALLLAGSALATSPLQLGGSGHGTVMNLDAGARAPGHYPSIGGGGFAAPATPQAMALDPGSLVHQAEIYRKDAQVAMQEAAAARDDVLSIYNRTLIAKSHAEGYATRAESMAGSAYDSANNAATCADRAEDSLLAIESLRNETSSLCSTAAVLFDRTSNVYNQTVDLAFKTMSSQSELATNSTATADDQDSDREALDAGLLDLAGDIEDLSMRVSELERRVDELVGI